jgi:hypothetical protein
VGHHRSASASGLLGLDGFEVFAAEVVGGEWQLVVQTMGMVIGGVGCGVRAEAHGRRTVRVRDLPDRRPAGGAVVSRGADLDRAGGRGRSAGGADRTGPRRGLPAGW